VVFKKIGNKSIAGDSVIYDFRIHVMESASLAVAKKEVDDRDSLQNSLIGKPLPLMTLKSLSGDTISLGRYKGKPMLINLWFTNCGPCLSEIPDLNQLKTSFPDIHFVAVTFDKQEKVARFLKKRKFDFDHFVEANDFCFRFTSSFPLNILVDKDGIIRKITGGLPVSSSKKLLSEGIASELRKLKLK
jgi:thiol-disulfide isomerase/thioredoxin